MKIISLAKYLNFDIPTSKKETFSYFSQSITPEFNNFFVEKIVIYSIPKIINLSDIFDFIYTLLCIISLPIGKLNIKIFHNSMNLFYSE